MATKKDDEHVRAPQPGRATTIAHPPTPAKLNLTEAYTEKTPDIVRIVGTLENLISDTTRVSNSNQKLQDELIELESTVSKLSYDNEERLSAVEKLSSELPDAIAESLKEKYVPIVEKNELEKFMVRARNIVKTSEKWEVERKQQSDAARDIQAKEFSEQASQFEEVYARAKAFAKYEQLDKYFATKMSAHKKLHHRWLIAFVGVIVFSLFFVAAGSDVISGWLPTWTKDEFTFGKSILLIAPFLGVSWILRICLRLSMLNLQLSEDADNKTVLLRTLAALESDDITKLEKEQRLVAYNAIFRSSLPNNSNLDIAQPSIGELAKLGK